MRGKPLFSPVQVKGFPRVYQVRPHQCRLRQVLDLSTRRPALHLPRQADRTPDRQQADPARSRSGRGCASQGCPLITTMAVLEVSVKMLPIFPSHSAFRRFSILQEVSGAQLHSYTRRKRRNVPDPDTLLSPHELMHLHPHLGLRLQRERRRAGDFIPHRRNGRRRAGVADQQVSSLTRCNHLEPLGEKLLPNMLSLLAGVQSVQSACPRIHERDNTTQKHNDNH